MKRLAQAVESASVNVRGILLSFVRKDDGTVVCGWHVRVAIRALSPAKYARQPVSDAANAPKSARSEP